MRSGRFAVGPSETSAWCLPAALQVATPTAEDWRRTSALLLTRLTRKNRKINDHNFEVIEGGCDQGKCDANDKKEV